MMHDHDCLRTTNGLEDRDGSDGIDSPATSISNHGDSFKGRINSEYLVRIQTRVGAAENDGSSAAASRTLCHGCEIRRCVVCLREFALGFISLSAYTTK